MESNLLPGCRATRTRHYGLLRKQTHPPRPPVDEWNCVIVIAATAHSNQYTRFTSDPAPPTTYLRVYSSKWIVKSEQTTTPTKRVKASLQTKNSRSRGFVAVLNLCASAHNLANRVNETRPWPAGVESNFSHHKRGPNFLVRCKLENRIRS